MGELVQQMGEINRAIDIFIDMEIRPQVRIRWCRMGDEKYVEAVKHMPTGIYMEREEGQPVEDLAHRIGYSSKSAGRIEMMSWIKRNPFNCFLGIVLAVCIVFISYSTCQSINDADACEAVGGVYTSGECFSPDALLEVQDND